MTTTTRRPHPGRPLIVQRGRDLTRYQLAALCQGCIMVRPGGAELRRQALVDVDAAGRTYVRWAGR